MKVKIVFNLLVLLLVSAFSFEPISACSCAIQKVCQFYSNAKVVFTGKVLDSTETVKKIKHRERRIGSREWKENEYSEKRQISRLWVEESFTGTNGKTEILIETEISSSCALPLEKGVSYLIYAGKSETEENLMTYFCSGTKPLSSAQEDLVYLRAHKNNAAAISGKVGFGAWGKLYSAQLSKSGINSVSLENEDTKLSANIGQEGSYSFSNVPRENVKSR